MLDFEYQQLYSNDGGEIIDSAIYRMVKENNGLLDINKAYEFEISILSRARNWFNIRDYKITTVCLSFAEMIYYFATNQQDNIFGYRYHGVSKSNKVHSAYRVNLDDMKAMVASKAALQFIVSKVKVYRDNKLKTFEGSGCSYKDLYTKRCQWVDTLIKNIDNILSKANTDRIVIWDRSKAPVPNPDYKKAIKLTDDHDLNRLRLFLANHVNTGVEKDIKSLAISNGYRDIICDPYWSAETYTGSQGKVYKLVFHDEANRQKTVAKSKTADGLMETFRNRNALDDVTIDFDVDNDFKRLFKWYRPNIEAEDIWYWENFFSRPRYVAYIKSLNTKH